jgi:alpha-ketoglutaric semialdehyde dehydrogenase
MTLTRDEPALFNGAWRASAASTWLPVHDPADLRQLVGRVPALEAADIAAAFDGAEAGARAWRATEPLARGRVLTAAAQLRRERSAAIAADLVAEMGKTLAEASGEVAKAADFFAYYGSLARSAAGYTLNDERPGTTAGVRFEPVGIVLAITPWNDPLLTPARKVAPALFAGNSVILKPATETPLVSLHLARALTDAGLPPTVLSVVTGRGRDISAALLGDRRLAAVTFTGSNEVGLAIAQALAGRNIRVQTEMGGKNAAVVLADADLSLAAATIVAAAFAQAGQRCTATSRLIVDRAVAGELLDEVCDQAGQLRLGPGIDPATTLGPVVSRAQQQSVLDSVGQAVSQGCAVAIGGGAPGAPDLEHGCFVCPTVLRGVTPETAIWWNEVFGPVLAATEVDGFDAACKAVNRSVYGLSAAIFTTDLTAAHEFVERADTGQVAVNLPTSGWDVHHPFGGFRESGSPFKEQGVEALRFYSRTKTYAIRYGGLSPVRA